nr:MAG TPA: hypothetical protein [Caudoviricetes sp.]
MSARLRAARVCICSPGPQAIKAPAPALPRPCVSAYRPKQGRGHREGWRKRGGQLQSYVYI